MLDSDTADKVAGAAGGGVGGGVGAGGCGAGVGGGVGAGVAVGAVGADEEESQPTAAIDKARHPATASRRFMRTTTSSREKANG